MQQPKLQFPFVMSEKRYHWFKIAGSENELIFSENNLLVTEVNRKKITLAKYNGHLFASAYTCPHAGGMLSDGYVDVAGNLVCPLHGYKFNLANGLNISGEGYYLKTYPVEVREEGIYVGL